MPTESHIDYCAEQVRAYDYNRYFAATFAPYPVRRGLTALYAFNLEIASVRERVSEFLLGEMRLQWWRETVGGIYQGTVRNHAVVEELAWAIGEFDLPRKNFDRMIDGRMFDLGDAPPEDFQALEKYISATAGELVCLALAVCGLPEGRERGEHFGRIWGMAGVLRALPYHAAQRRIYLPNDLLRAQCLAVEGIIERKPGADPSPVVRIVVDRIRGIAASTDRLPSKIRPALSYVAIATAYLHRLEKAGYDVYAPGLEPTRFGGQLRILRTAWTGA